MNTSIVVATAKPRVHVFVDFWNFQLALNKIDPPRFDANFKMLGPLLAQASMKVIGEADAKAEFAGLNVYISSDMKSQAEAGLRRWAAHIDGFSGVNANLVPRRKEKEGPKCPNKDCRKIVGYCPHCNGDMRGTKEKGVDVRIATDMITLAWENTYDIGVLVSADSDFVPLAEFLQKKGKKIIHGKFPPKGAELTQKCWGHIDLTEIRDQFKFVKN